MMTACLANFVYPSLLLFGFVTVAFIFFPTKGFKPLILGYDLLGGTLLVGLGLAMWKTTQVELFIAGAFLMLGVIVFGFISPLDSKRNKLRWEHWTTPYEALKQRRAQISEKVLLPEDSEAFSQRN